MNGRIRTASCVAASAVLAAGLLVGCGSPTASSPQSGDDAGALTVQGGTFGQVTDNFNPFVYTSASSTLALTTFIYEPLFQYDSADAAKTYPWLATAANWTNHDKTLTITLRRGVKWSDGTAFTSADVVFTLDLLKKYPALNGNGITFSNVRADGPYTVIVTFPTPSYSEYYYILGLTLIVPKHIWAKVDPTKYPDKDPIGTGPYVLSRYTDEGVTLSKNPDYWQHGLPKVQKLYFPDYYSNDPLDAAIENGSVQWSASFINNVKKLYVDKSKYNHAWNSVYGPNLLFINVRHAPLNQVALRRAMSLALNRQEIDNLGESGQEPPVKTETALAMPVEKSSLDPKYAEDNFTTNVSKARAILAAAGFKRSTSGALLTPAGSPVRLTIIDPSGFTDYMADAQLIAEQLKSIGIAITVQGISSSTWQSDLNDGLFQLSIDGPTVGPSPYYLYDSLLDYRLSAPIGQAASGDFGRWDDPATQRALKDFVDADTTKGRAEAIDALEGIMVKDVPDIALVQGVNFAQYSTKEYVGWPSASDPYQTATPEEPTEEQVVLHLRPRTQR